MKMRPRCCRRVRLARSAGDVAQYSLGAAVRVVLTNARAIGEFGAVSVVSGSIRGETLSLPLQLNYCSRITHRRLVHRRRPADVNGYSDPVFKEYVAMASGQSEKSARQEGNHEHLDCQY